MKQLTRRQFVTGVAGAGLAGATGLAVASRPWDASPGDAAQRSAARSTAAARSSAPDGDGIVVMVGMYGGNDGLNTVIPYHDSAYLAGRTGLAYQPDQVIPLADGLALNPSLSGFKTLWDAGHLAIVRGVGYPMPVLSHFRSMAIWQAGSPDAAVATGWLGRWLDATGDSPLRAVGIGPTLPPALVGAKASAAAVPTGPMVLPGGALFRQDYATLEHPTNAEAQLIGQVARSGTDLLTVQAAVTKALAAVPATLPSTTLPSTTLPNTTLPNTTLPSSTASSATAPTSTTPGAGAPYKPTGGGQLAPQLEVVSRLIKAGFPARAYFVSLASFDTHVNEKAEQARLLADLDTGVSGFLASLAGDPKGEKVVVATFSEFGRRVAGNASGGTDHGTAAPLFVAGLGVKGGAFYGEEPSLTALDSDGNLKFNMDFRSVYATLLGHVLGYESTSLLGARFPTIPFL
jgi:uncharacterized protein (DUF1501 family)